MTLILTIANSLAVYQSSDYQLIDQKTRKPLSDRAGSKQLQASFKNLNLMVAFTGVAAVGAQRTIDRLSAVLRGLPEESTFPKINEALLNNIRPLGTYGHLALVASAASIGRPLQVAFISNFDWRTRPPSFKRDFFIELRTITRPFWRVSGLRDFVTPHELARLKALASRIGNASQNEIMDTLAQINASAARNSGNGISEECWVTTQSANDRNLHFSTRNVGGQPGFISQMMGGFDFAEFIRQNFQAAPGQEIGFVQSAGGAGPGTPSPGPEGDPRDFILSGSAKTVIFNSPSSQPTVSIEIAPISTTVSVRHFDSVTVPFAEIRLTSIGAAGKDFPRPKFPWPQLLTPLSLNGVAVPDRQYLVGYWVEGGVHHVEIPQSHCPIRENSILGEGDDLYIVAPAETQLFRLKNGETVTAVLEARFAWQARPK